MSRALLISAAVVAGFAVWLALVQWWYALDEDRPAPLFATTADGWTLAVWRRPPAVRRFREAVVLCHGFANNASFMDFHGAQNLAAFLAGLGFDCFSVDLRGAGSSRGPHEGPHDATFDDHLHLDLPAVLDLVQRTSGVDRVHWVGHSLGGLLGLAAAATTEKERIATVTTIGSPLFFRFRPALGKLVKLGLFLASPSGQLATGALALVAPFAGRVPAPRLAHLTANLHNLTAQAQRLLVVNVFAPMWRGVMAQLGDWLLHDAFRSVDGKVDYRQAVARLQLPVLVVGGTVDVMAPPDVTRDYFELLATPDKQLALFGRSYGHALEYGHGDLVVGTHAPAEVYPVLRDFLVARATPAGVE
ncbi:MAG: alpha/beta fold hydrolase [Myxococcota bacterium]